MFGTQVRITLLPAERVVQSRRRQPPGTCFDIPRKDTMMAITAEFTPGFPTGSTTGFTTATSTATAVSRATSTVDFDPRAPSRLPRLRPTRLRLTRRGRIVLSVLAALPVIVAMLLSLVNGGVAAADAGGSTVTITVSAGQTLWSLAEVIAPAANPADVVADIVAVNALDGGAVQAGQSLVLPAAYVD